MKFIGVLCSTEEAAAAAEFFQLFKTPWEPFVPGRDYDVVISTVPAIPATNARRVIVFGSEPRGVDAAWGVEAGGVRRGGMIELGDIRLPVYGQALTFRDAGCQQCCGSGLRVGYDLFKEVAHLLNSGQPSALAGTPTLDLHIEALRCWILNAGVELAEVSPTPADCQFAVCLTHDIDFFGIRRHLFDHSMWGFLHRATLGAAVDFSQRRIGLTRLLRCWGAALTLPFVYVGMAQDFWLPFAWYLEVERRMGAAYYVMPFKRRAGQKVTMPYASRRATAYDVADLAEWLPRLREAGFEIGVHGIDAWHDVELARQEQARVGGNGIRIHWLMWDRETFRVLDEAGYEYDTTFGYNDTVGFRAGTAQVYRPLGVRHLLELPLHIQDGALFAADHLDLPELQAWELCRAIIQHCRAHGGVLTILWHGRSHAPERCWGDFYKRLLNELKAMNVWFGRAGDVVDWYRARRAVVFERRPAADGTEQVVARLTGGRPCRPFALRFQTAGESRIEKAWSGAEEIVVG